MAKLVSRGEGKIDKRYRPCRLSEVFGNENLVNSLNNWFSQGEKRSKVLLFQNGPGTGKTTLARILALGLNCENGESGEPCLECSSCKSIDFICSSTSVRVFVSLNSSRKESLYM